MTRSLARELGTDNITVNAIAPGLVEVEATRYVPAERHAHYLNQRAIQRPQLPADCERRGGLSRCLTWPALSPGRPWPSMAAS